MFTEGPKYELVMQTQCLDVVCLVKTITVRMPAVSELHCVRQGARFGDVNLGRLLSRLFSVVLFAGLSRLGMVEGNSGKVAVFWLKDCQSNNEAHMRGSKA